MQVFISRKPALLRRRKLYGLNPPAPPPPVGFVAQQRRRASIRIKGRKLYPPRRAKLYPFIGGAVGTPALVLQRTVRFTLRR